MPPRMVPARTTKWGKPILFGLFLFAVACAVIVWRYVAPPNPNRLAIGEAAKVAGEREIRLNQPVDLNFKAREDIFAVRRNCVQQHPELLAMEVQKYELYPPVFDQIVDGKPWWGIAGQFYYGPGKHSIRGMAEESRFICNPYLLVAPDLGKFNFKEFNVPEGLVDDPDFPFVCLPDKLVWDARGRSMQVHYPLSKFNTRIAKLVHAGDAFDVHKPLVHWSGMVAYNARDLGLAWLYIDPRHSVGIETAAMQPIAIPQFIHCGGSCGYPGGCNNMSPWVPEIDNITIQQVPARIAVRLWENRPSNATEPADMTCMIYLD